MKKIVVEEKIEIPGTNILLEAGDTILYKEELEGEVLRKLDVPEKEINLILDGCHSWVIDAIIAIGKKFRGSFNIGYSGFGNAEMYNPLSGLMVEISDRDITITTDEDTIEFDNDSSGVNSAIKYISKYRRY